MITHNDATTLRSEFMEMLFPLRRIVRCIGYFVVSHLFLSINTYGVGHEITIPFALAVLAAASASARIAQIAISILAIMTVIPIDVLRTIAGVLATAH